MSPFRYAEDYYGGWLAQQVLAPTVLLFFVLVLLLAGIHLLRRSFGHPVCARPPNGNAHGHVTKYEPGARLYHWGNFGLLAGLVLSGAALLVPGSVKPRLWTWLRLHEVLAGGFLLGVIVHAVIAPTKGEGRAMWFARSDWKDFRLITANFFGRTRDYPCFGKYDPLQKVYHAFLAVGSAAVIFSGVFLFLNVEALVTVGHEWLRGIRLLHDLSGAVLTGVVLGHIYFGVIRANWPELRAIFTGEISAAHFRLRHGPERWMPPHSKENRHG